MTGWTVKRTIDVLIVGCLVASLARHVATRPLPPHKPVQSRAPLLRVNAHFGLQGIKWNTTQRTIVLFMNTACDACEQSSDLYRTLSEHIRQRHDIRLVVISAEDSLPVSKWLIRHKIRPQYVAQASSPSSLGLLVTPTLLLVDNNGDVSDMLVTRLSHDEETQLWSRLSGHSVISLDNSTRTFAAEVEEATLTSSLEADPHIVILDIRDRDSYKGSHRSSAINIPGDELVTRAPAELSTESKVVVDCGTDDIIACRSAGMTLRRLGFEKTTLSTRQRAGS